MNIMECYDENEMPAVEAPSKGNKHEIDEATSVAVQFSEYFHDILEKKPHLVGQLYLENSVMVWDGNPIFSREGIQKFIELQIPSLTFQLSSMDCQSISGVAVATKKSFIITLGGQVRVSGPGTRKSFSRQIVITQDNDKWRIALDNFRSQE